MSLLYGRALLLAKIEDTFRVDAEPAAATDAFLVEDPSPSLDITQLTRTNVKADLSPDPSVAGRKIASITFLHEVRSNGNVDGTVPPKLGTLLRACGLAQTQVTGASGTIGNAAADGGNTGTIAFAKTTAYAGYMKRTVTIECTTGGASGAAEVTVSAPATAEYPAFSATGVVVTDATPIDLPNSAQVTPTVGTSLVIGDTWTIELTPAGYYYSPVSEDFESVTIYAYFDGLLHKMTGCRGTFSVEATGGNYAKFNFTFTGDYVPVEDAAIPTDEVFETQQPTQVELANLIFGEATELCAAGFTIDMANDVQIRECINGLNSYEGGVIVGRQPVISFDPEAVLEATHPFWGNLADGTGTEFEVKVGAVKGNVVHFYAPNVQETSLAYGNRNNIRTYDVSLNCARVLGDDELTISFR